MNPLLIAEAAPQLIASLWLTYHALRSVRRFDPRQTTVSTWWRLTVTHVPMPVRLSAFFAFAGVAMLGGFVRNYWSSWAGAAVVWLMLLFAIWLDRRVPRERSYAERAGQESEDQHG